MVLRRRLLFYETHDGANRFLADIYAYRAAAACENEDELQAKRSVDSLIINTLMCGVDKCGYVDQWKLFLTGKGNFRNDIAVTATYKGNRADKVKPKHLAALRSHLMQEWKADMSEGQEADDSIAIEATTLGDNGVIVSLDKDLDQVAGWHYNFVKKEAYYITESEGLLRLYMQILTGDTADNIIGLRGIGNVKAKKMLEDALDETELFQRCVEAYDGNEDRVVENAHLLFLRRHEGQIWKPPVQTN
jgi:hypothetical protein